MKIKLSVVILTAVFVVGSIFLFMDFVKSGNSNIVITEICPRGCAANKEKQWVEIYNKSNDPVSIENWKFYVEEESDHGINNTDFTQSYIIEPGEYAIIAHNYLEFLNEHLDFQGKLYDSTWNRSLYQDGDTIGLKDNNGDWVEASFRYKAIQNNSLERKNVELQADDDSNWAEHPDSNSIGQKNYWAVQDGGEEYPTDNHPPVAIIVASSTAYVADEAMFDGSGSYDSDGTLDSFQWTVDSIFVSSETILSYTFTARGTFNIVLTVIDDDGASASSSLIVQIENKTEDESSGGEDIPNSAEALVVINEFVSDPITDAKEWIELYSVASSTMDLNGWTLSDGVGKIATLVSTIEPETYLVVEFSTSKLNNAGDLIILKNILGEVVDQVRYGDWVDETDGDSSDNAPAAGDPNSMARVVDGQDTNNDKNDFAETTMPTPSETNIIIAPIVEVPQDSGGGGGNFAPTTLSVTYDPGDLVINELVSDPTDDYEEFVELFNTNDGPIDLTGWWIEDGSETKTTLEGIIFSQGFFVIEKPKGSLNNPGDIVILFDPSGKEIDCITYGSWDDGNLADNAPAPSDPLSLARKIDGLDADNDYYDFVLTSTVTKGGTNVISSVTKDGEIVEQLTGSTNIIINEVMPNPKGSDNEDEFIEFFNKGNETVSLKDWKLGDSSTKRYTIAQGYVQPGGYIVFKRSMTGIALNNTGGDEVKLFASNGALVDSVQYPGSSKEDESYAKREDESWAWTSKPTPGKTNIIEGKSAAPIISIDTETEVSVNEWVIFDASDTTDPDGEEVKFSWDFDDGETDDGVLVEHKFKKEGTYSVKLVASDGTNESEKKVVVTVKLSSDFVGGYGGASDVTKLQISEIVPNPTGSDTTEFIELFNPTGEDIDISSLKLDDDEAGSRIYTIPENTFIKASEYKVFGRQDTGLALNNTSDSVRILYPDGTVVAEISYDDVLEGHAYVRNDEGQWVWTSVLTPGEENIFAAPKVVQGSKTIKKSNYIKPIITTTLENIRNEDIGDKVQVTGIVAVEPGVLGSQYFYVVGSPGVQVYMYKKDFPDLSIGDRVEITGELSESGGETRIKTSEKSDIKKIDHAGEPQPRMAEAAEVGEPLEGWLITVNGEITELKGSYMYIDDGTEEVKVYFKRGAGIKKDVLQEGDIVSVTGLVSQTKSGYQLLPRFQEDILKTGVAEEMITKVEQEKKQDAADLAEKYLTATAGGLTAIFVGLLGKSHGGKVGARVKKISTVVLHRVRRRKE